MTIAGSNFAASTISSARHDINFSDSDLTQLRDDTKAILVAQNPLLFPKSDTVSDTSASRTKRIDDLSTSSHQFVYFVKTNITRFAEPLTLLAFGFIIYLIGIFTLAASTVDLSCQDFEERPLEIWHSLFDSLKKHTWKILLLYFIYVAANALADGILSALPGEAANLLGGFVTMTEIYLTIRLIATVPALVSEELGPFKALARSWQLTRRDGGRIFGITIVFGVMLFSISMIVSIIAGFAFSGVTDWVTAFFASGPLSVKWLLDSLPGFLAATAGYSSVIMFVVLALLPTFGTVLYYDLRTRQDGPLIYLD